MPNLFRISGYSVYFWTNEGLPTEPIHVHVSKGKPNPNATKLWISQSGQCVICHNNSEIPDKMLLKIMKTIEANSDDVKSEWEGVFGQISYYC